MRIHNFIGHGSIARRNLDEMEQLFPLRPQESIATGELTTPSSAEEFGHRVAEYSGVLFTWESRIRECAAITIVFSAAALEHYINDFGARQLGDTYYEQNLEMLSPQQKWIVLPRLARSHQMDRGGRAFELLNTLFRARNELMHTKSREFSPQRLERQLENPIIMRARLAVQALDALRREAQQFDDETAGHF